MEEMFAKISTWNTSQAIVAAALILAVSRLLR